MNLSEVLNVALPELPARKTSKSFPCLHPKLIMREQIEGGVPTMVAMISGGSMIFRFSPEQWQLVQLFDGKRSYREICDLFEQQTGIAFAEEDVHEFADALDEGEFWPKTSLDQNITGKQKLAEERQRRAKKKIDISLMSLSAWDPDVYLTRLHKAISFVYTKWFTYLTLALFTIMALIFVGGWHEIWRDTVEYYTFTNKGTLDLAEFWLLFCGLGFFHESAHGLTCKHFGGGVHRMGFMLIYLSPAFFCDVGEVYVYGGKWPRVAAIISGIWVELIFCSVASIMWWGMPTGSFVHDFAYKIMLITGVAVVLMNLNPLIKLDGYYLFGELVGVSTLKESSTEYVASWVKRNVFHLPVEVPHLRRRRRWLFVGYALISGLYSYLVLFAVVRLSYNVFSRFSPLWAFVPAAVLGLLILRARLRSSVRFMKDLYLDKRPHWVAWWTIPRKVVVGGLLLLALFAPLAHETVGGRFVLEPKQRAVIRATVPGQITEVLTDEGLSVAAGAPILRLRNDRLEAEADSLQANLQIAEANARQAQLSYTDLGPARAERASQFERYRSVSEQVAELQVLSPISGIVVTPRLQNLVGSYIHAGQELVEVDDVNTLQARIFVPEFEIQRIMPSAPASLKLEFLFRPIRAQVSSILPASSAPAPGLLPAAKYQGIALPRYYVATVPISNTDRNLRPGMSGEAKITLARRSIVGFMWRHSRNFVERKIW